MLIFADSESCGLVGPTKLIQFCIGDEEPELIPLFSDWTSNPSVRGDVEQFLSLLHKPSTTLVLYNAVHDLLHFYRLEHMLLGLPCDSFDRPVMPFECKVLDMQIHASTKSDLAPFAFSKGPSRGVARVSKIPVQTKDQVKKVVGERLVKVLPECVREHLKCSEKIVKDEKGKIRKDLVTLVWYIGQGVFSLKGLMKHFGLPTLKLKDLWPLPTGEKPWLPYPQPCHDEIEHVCETIMSDSTHPFYTYARLDPLFTRYLWERLGSPTEPTDNDDLTAVVGYTRYYGFELDQRVLKTTARYYRRKIQRAEELLAGINLRSSKQRLALLQKYDPLIASSKKQVVEKLAESDRPCAPAARAICNHGLYSQRLNQVEQMIECRTGRMHASLRVLGTATNRSAGTDGFNVQGICAPKKFKNGAKLGLRHAILVAGGGDFDSLEVNIMAPVYGDKQLQEDLKSGLQVHLMTGILVSPLVKAERDRAIAEELTKWPTLREAKVAAGEKIYERALQAYHDEKHPEHEFFTTKIRKKHGKGTVFATGYGAQPPKIAEVLACSIEEAQDAWEGFFARYPGIKAFRSTIEKSVCTADTEGWDRDSVKQMARSCTSIFGYRRNWDFEARVAEIMWSIGQTGIRLDVDGRVTRSKEKGEQSFANAVRSACLGAAISIQAAVARQMANAGIQIPGSECCKSLGARYWRQFRVPFLIIHDEYIFPHHPHFRLARIQRVTEEFITETREKIPTIAIEIESMNRWSDKK